jgi:hypothetical protein
MLLRVHEMMVLSALVYGSAAYGSVSHDLKNLIRYTIENSTGRFLRVQNRKLYV